MIDEVKRLLDEYMLWLKDKTTLRQIDDKWIEITTPYLDRHNDFLQIYARRQNGEFLLTDDGNTIRDLTQTGCALDSPKRQALLNMTLNGFGVHLNQGALEVSAGEGNFALRKHNLVQAMLAVNDLFFLAVPYVASLFYEDVVAWLDFREIRYTPQVKFTGKTGFDHLFDFVIPRSKAQPERILEVINSPSRDTANMLVFAWLDTKGVRPVNSRAYAILNDSEREVPVPVLDALRNYDVKPALWSKRASIEQELAA